MELQRQPSGNVKRSSTLEATDAEYYKILRKTLDARDAAAVNAVLP
jgi:hypothetical protein